MVRSRRSGREERRRRSARQPYGETSRPRVRAWLEGPQTRPSIDELPPNSITSFLYSYPNHQSRDLYPNSSSRPAPFQAKLYAEPETICDDLDNVEREIESDLRRDRDRVPRPNSSCASTSSERTSRASSVTSPDELAVVLQDLTLGPRRLANSRIHQLARGIGQYHPSHSVFTPSNYSHVDLAGGSDVALSRGAYRQIEAGNFPAESSTGNTNQKKKAKKSQKQGKAKARDENVAQEVEDPAQVKGEVQEKRFLACPVCQALPNEHRHIFNICTLPQGIPPELKYLNEHLKENHTLENRCLSCHKRCKSASELNAHGSVDCSPSPTNQRVLFTDIQELNFKTRILNKFRATEQTPLDEVWRQIFDILFPNHPRRESISPFYNYYVLNPQVFESSPDQDDLTTASAPARAVDQTHEQADEEGEHNNRQHADHRPWAEPYLPSVSHHFSKRPRASTHKRRRSAEPETPEQAPGPSRIPSSGNISSLPALTSGSSRLQELDPPTPGTEFGNLGPPPLDHAQWNQQLLSAGSSLHTGTDETVYASQWSQTVVDEEAPDAEADFDDMAMGDDVETPGPAAVWKQPADSESFFRDAFYPEHYAR